MSRRTLVGFTTIQLIDSLAYIGYSTASWDQNVRAFILGTKNQTYIFDLNLTILFLKNALSFFFEVCIKKGVCALVNENEMFSKRFDAYFDESIAKIFRYRRLVIVSKKLSRGILTNRKMFETRLEVFRTFPHAFFISSPSHSSFFVEESRILAVPSITVCDTIHVPFSTPYMIPANEKSFKTLLLFNTLFYLYFTRAFLLRSCFFKREIATNLKRKLVKARARLLLKKRLLQKRAAKLRESIKKKSNDRLSALINQVRAVL